MIAKIITYGADRNEALARMRAALAATEVTGLNTNRAFLLSIASHPAFANAELDTGFIARHHDVLLPAPKPASDEVLAIAAYAFLRHEQQNQRQHTDAADPFSPWADGWGWRLGHKSHADLLLLDGEHRVTLRADYTRDGLIVAAVDKEQDNGINIRGIRSEDGSYRLHVGGRQCNARVLIGGHTLTVFVDGGEYHLRYVDPRLAVSADATSAGHLVAPMPGVVASLAVKVGDKVEKGAALIVVEAMKMEHTIVAPYDGTVKVIHYAVGDQVAEGKDLLELEAKSE